MGDSQLSLPSSVCTTSTVSSIDDKLDLVCSILQNIEQDTTAEEMEENLSRKEMEIKKRQIRQKLARMKQYLQNIEPNIDRLFGLSLPPDEESEDEDDDVVNIVHTNDQQKCKKSLLTSRNLSLLSETTSGQSLLGIANGKIKFNY